MSSFRGAREGETFKKFSSYDSGELKEAGEAFARDASDVGAGLGNDGGLDRLRARLVLRFRR